ncbi:MAG: hypothetical protein AB1744_10675, partial [Candidatus Zixiibacteriota bacterium]
MRISAVAMMFVLPAAAASAIDIKPKGEQVTTETKTADSLLQQADATFQAHDHKAALKQYETAYERARGEFNRSVEVEALSQVARMHLIVG